MHIRGLIWPAAVTALSLGLATQVAGATTDLNSPAMDEITVTGTREAVLKSETPGTVNNVSTAEVEEVKPAHPGEVMNRMPGVHVNVTGGEGHMTSIRQPITTKALYLYLEDGIPTRSTGFFNHNALYEINVPQAGGIEVLKGPGTALFGSDAIGAVINVMTKSPPLEPEVSLGIEAGEHGWKRLLVSGGNSDENDGVRADLNLTHTDGWRDATEYDRYSGTLRWDRYLDNGANLKTVFSTSKIDQETAGSSRLLRDDYLNNPTLNYTPISFRKVEAFRLSTAYEQEGVDDLLSITPYVRRNTMELLPNWALSYDPTVYETENDSVGLLLKYRKDIAPYATRIIVGTDLDYSPGSRMEHEITPTKVGNFFTSFTQNGVLYDYDAAFYGISPYVHVESSPVDKLRLNAGLRYDHMEYDYDNNLSVVTTGDHRRPSDTRVSFDHLSPKLGATYAFSPTLNGFASYRHGFRVPSESQLFRQGKSTNTVDLDAIKVDSYEVGLRGQANSNIRYEASVYLMRKDDDILTFKETDGSRTTMNAGETLHRGIELGLGADLSNDVDLNVSFSYAKHTYEDWKPNTTTDLSGNEMESAPRRIINTRLNYRPALLNGGRGELEWVQLGSYWMDQANSHRYDGHDLFNVRVNYLFNKKFEIYGRITNLTDKRYATAASYSPAAFGNPEKFEFAPGQPRTFFLGVNYAF